ncbi:energy-coupled thiamine transporter ThiT [Clostridium akagii]|uniref:energy-coupled thiamine transporter ThiT n=1 Tax=Clostridium akagii TaxID=91623 RepID=UPI00047EA8D1|nr:energy-coupled thiamine transporter ThiT [Clostridium akagii]
MFSFIKNLVPSFLTNVTEISHHPSSVITLVGLLLLVLGFVKIRKVKLNTKMITQIGIALALSAVLQIFRIYHFPQGGGVTFGSLVPILLIAFIYGPEVGILAGFLHGMLTLIIDPYILYPTQLLFDYPLPSMALGLAGYFRNQKILGSVVALFVKFICHFISGVLFFGSFAPKGTSPIIYSLSVNGSLMLAEGAICVIIIGLLPMKILSKALTGERALT